uniref:hypothetical protein n=1 Tax=Sphingopyxis indica TaxID=436663 RepID=UPI002939420B|nr:hypothetical protein [Sphingopyxis indica]
MPRALEMLDATFRRIEQGQIDDIEALDDLLAEELTLRENRRVKAALRMTDDLRVPEREFARAALGFDSCGIITIIDLYLTSAAEGEMDDAHHGTGPRDRFVAVSCERDVPGH